MNIKVFHIVAGDLNGGAARGAYWLHLGLKELGVDSKLFTDSELTFGDKNVITITRTKGDKLRKLFRENLDFLFTLFYRKRKNEIFSTGFLGVDFKKNQAFLEADVIHLHWINNNFINIRHLKNIQKPIVWTLRDMWPMTGGCHVAEALNCQNYLHGCGNCKLLGSSNRHDLSSIVFRRKRKFYNDKINLVGISNWITKKASESELFKNYLVSTIPNCIDTAQFFPVDKQIARQLLNIKSKKKIILTGATSQKYVHKGFSKYLETIGYLDRDKYLLLFFGKLNDNVVDLSGFEYVNLGFIQDNIALRIIYSSADVFIAPSLMESFGKTLTESMACETPVVCFDATGPKDIVDHKINGYKALPFESEDLSKGVEWIIDNNIDNRIGKSARVKVLQEYSKEIIAQKYIHLYQQLLNGKSD